MTRKENITDGIRDWQIKSVLKATGNTKRFAEVKKVVDALKGVASAMDKIPDPRNNNFIDGYIPRNGTVKVVDFLKTHNGGGVWRAYEKALSDSYIDAETGLEILDRLGLVVLGNYVDHQALQERLKEGETIGYNAPGRQRRTCPGRPGFYRLVPFNRED